MHIILEGTFSSLARMLQAGLILVRRFFPQIMLPITITVGFIGYSIENYFRPPSLPEGKSQSVSEIREERRLRDLEKKS